MSQPFLLFLLKSCTAKLLMNCLQSQTGAAKKWSVKVRLHQLRGGLLSSMSTVILIIPVVIISSKAQAQVATGNEESLQTEYLLVQNIAQQAVSAEKGELKLGASGEQEMKGGETHSYRITLKAGQYVNVAVEQKGIDVLVRIFGPDGQKLTQVDNDPAVGLESVSVVAETSGDYRLEVQSSNKVAKTGRYQIKLEELREATPKDRIYMTAEKSFEEGNQLRDQQTAESRRKAMEKYEGALPRWKEIGNKKGEAYTLIELGFVNSSLGDSKRALEYYSQALTLWREIGDNVNEAIALNNIGIVHWRLSEFRKALEFFALALPLQRTSGDRKSEAITLNNTGLMYHNLGDLQTALKFYGQALPLRRATADGPGEASTLTNIGEVQRRLGEMQKALEYYDQALPLWRNAGNRRGEGLTLNNIGAVYTELGQPQKAIECYDQALPLRRNAGDRQGEAQTLHNLGRANSSLGEQQKAVTYYNQALALFHVIGDRSGEASALSSIGDIYAVSGDQPKALDHFHQALSLRQTIGDQYGEAFTLTSIGFSHRRLGEPQKALEYYRQALQLSQSVGDQNGEAKIRNQMAHALRALGNIGEARAQIEAALNLIEPIRAKLTSPELRSSVLASRQDYYKFYIDLLMQMHRQQPLLGHDAAALQASERARARGLLEILTEARADIRQGIDPLLLERERSSQQQLSAKSEWMTRLLNGKHTEEQVTAAKKELKTLMDEYQEVEAQIRANSPHYAALTQPQPLSLKEIQRLLDKDTLMLEYSLGEERSYLWVASESAVSSYELPKRADIEALARRVYELLTARNQQFKFETAEKRRARIAKADAAYWQAAKNLSEVLFQATKEQIKNKRLLIVADGILQYIPFAALPSLQETRRSTPLKPIPLIANHEIVSLPSASTLGVLRREFESRQPAPKIVAVLADPVFDKNDERVKVRDAKIGSAIADKDAEGKIKAKMLDSELTRSARDFGSDDGELYFPRLPSTRREAEAIVAVVPPVYSQKAVDFSASETTARDAALGQFRYVHFATHGLINSAHPELSGIVLSLVDQHGAEQDGFLVTHEIYNLNLPVEMVVLSGCKTGLGKEIKGEGLIGLTRGFMYAGAARVMVSLWDINDESTADLMARLYKNLLGKQRLSPAAALREAQLSLWNSRRWRPPYYWAAFLLQGEYK